MTSNRTFCFVMATLVGFGIQVAEAAPIAIVNSDFEAEAVADGAAVFPPITGWVGASAPATGLFDPPVGSGAPFAGENNFLFVNTADSTGFGGALQTLAATITANTTYTLSTDIGHGTDFPDFPPVSDGDAYNPGTSNVIARLLSTPDGGTTFNDLSSSLVSSTAATVAAGSVDTWTLVYETGSSPTGLGEQLVVQLFSQGIGAVGTGPFTQVLFDNATLDASPIGGGGVFGDYNGDDKVDAADYVVWRANLGASIALPNEDATPGTVTQEDYTVWMNNFGKMAGSGTGSTSAATVPEPAGAWLLLIAFFVLVSFSTSCRDGRWRIAGGRRISDC